jgi:hypothetical protein
VIQAVTAAHHPQDSFYPQTLNPHKALKPRKIQLKIEIENFMHIIDSKTI